MRRQHDIVMRRGPFISYPHPTDVFLFLYDTKDKAMNEESAFIAMSSFDPGNKSPAFNIHAPRLTAAKAGPKTINKLTDDSRRRIYFDLVRSQDRAEKEAEKQHPTGSGSKSSAQKKAEYQAQLWEKYAAELMTKHNLNRKQLDDIVWEGITKAWPMPPH